MMSALKHHFPLCFISDESICTYKHGRFYRLNILDQTMACLASLRIPVSERISSRVNFLSRLLRTGVRYGKRIGPDEVLFVHDKTIRHLDIKAERISSEYRLEKGSRPLSMATIQGLDGFANGIYFGEYFSNPHKTRVKILKRDGNGRWQEAGFFSGGAINHIHALVPDRFRQCVWILTGDSGNSAGIWYSRNGFRTIEPALIGNQEFRACVAFPTEQGLLYATDSPSCPNSVRLLTLSNNTWTSEKVVEIDGPVIYGCQLRNDFVFSTSVEGNGTERGLKMLLGRERGKGIKAPLSYIYLGNPQRGFEKVYGDRKDILPFALFQYGVILFPEGENRTNVLPFYPIALRKNDLSLQTLKIGT